LIAAEDLATNFLELDVLRKRIKLERERNGERER
jgi:hypothetical protein